MPLPVLKFYLDIRLTTDKNHENPQGNERVLGNVRSVETVALFRAASLGLIYPVPYSSGPRDMGVFRSAPVSPNSPLGSSLHQPTF